MIPASKIFIARIACEPAGGMELPDTRSPEQRRFDNMDLYDAPVFQGALRINPDSRMAKDGRWQTSSPLETRFLNKGPQEFEETDRIKFDRTKF